MKEYRRINVEGVIYYGKHLILTARQCNENLLDKAKMAAFLRQLVDKIDMVAFGDPIVERFGQGIEIGLSGVQLIETSAITFHTNDQARDMYLDVFSCKTFPEDVVCQVVKEILQPLSTNYQVLMR